MKQILIESPVKLREIIQFGCRNGADVDLGLALMRLLHFLTADMVMENPAEPGKFLETDGDQVAVISADFAPHSLRFFTCNGTSRNPSEWKRGPGFSNGGFIYEGPGCPKDGSAPTLCVSLGKSEKKHSWGIHT